MPDVTDTRRGNCAECGRGKRALVKAKVEWSDTCDEVTAWEMHYILECGGCGALYHQIVQTDSEQIHYGRDGEMELIETITHWPDAPARTTPEWFPRLMDVDRDLYLIVHEIYKALDVDLPIVAAIAMRTALDRATEVLKVDPSLPFEKKIEQLMATGRVGADEREHVTTMIEAGNAAAHRGWRPSKSDLDALMSSLESFLYRNFIASGRLQAVRRKVPPKPPRKKAKKT